MKKELLIYINNKLNLNTLKQEHQNSQTDGVKAVIVFHEHFNKILFIILNSINIFYLIKFISQSSRHIHSVHLSQGTLISSNNN